MKILADVQLPNRVWCFKAAPYRLRKAALVKYSPQRAKGQESRDQSKVTPGCRLIPYTTPAWDLPLVMPDPELFDRNWCTRSLAGLQPMPHCVANYQLCRLLRDWCLPLSLRVRGSELGQSKQLTETSSFECCKGTGQGTVSNGRGQMFTNQQQSPKLAMNHTNNAASGRS